MISAPTSTTFFGVDRTAHIQRLSGSRWAATTTPPEEILIDGLRRLTRRGGTASHAFVPPAFFSALCKQLQSRGSVPLVEVKTSNPNVGFRGVNMVGPGGDVTGMLVETTHLSQREPESYFVTQERAL